MYRNRNEMKDKNLCISRQLSWKWIVRLSKDEFRMDTQVRKNLWIAGGDGLVGRQLAAIADREKFKVYILTRKQTVAERDGVHFIQWDTEAGTIASDLVPDIILNLAGAGIADGRWTAKRKSLLVSSRVRSAETIEKYLIQNGLKPELYLSASAVGYYGDRGNSLLTEDSAQGHEFMSDCCGEWEKAAVLAGRQCQRTVILRIGIVLSMLGGALPKMLMTRGVSLFTYFGNGRQYYPWIHIDDLVRLLLACINETKYEGVYNAVSPQQIPNKEMMSSIMDACGFKGILMPAPAFLLRLAMGEMSRVVLNSNRADAGRLQRAGFNWEFTEVGKAVKDLLSSGH
jgi:uncharacterized protein (TIGR01777 family)